MSLDQSTFVAAWLIGSGHRGFHFRVHSSGLDVTWPAGVHMDDANAMADKVKTRLSRVEGAEVERDWHESERHRVAAGRALRKRPSIKQVDEYTETAMLRFADGAVAWVSVQFFGEHRHWPLVQYASERRWRCQRCGKRPLVRELKAAGLR